jgi:ribose transport system permease protein
VPILHPSAFLRRLFFGHGMVAVLILICAFFSFVTYAEQFPTGAAAGNQLADRITGKPDIGSQILVVVRNTEEDRSLAATVSNRLVSKREIDVCCAEGPAEAREKLHSLGREHHNIDALVLSSATKSWPVFEDLEAKYPGLGPVRILSPETYYWPNFLKSSNLLNILNQIVVIAMIAIGMTLVIITGGIDLSVGSLMALSAVTATMVIRKLGAEHASTTAMVAGCMVGVALCAGMGSASGAVITFLGVPPFIATLGMMLVASGLAYILAQGQSIYELPETFIWLGRGTTLGGIPNAVVLTAILYVVAGLVMQRTVFGRYVYAVGGNITAAWLSGLPVRSVLILVYVISGALAGLGGVVMASQLKSGSPTYGQMYELYVIAAVVVGGTSLSGGEGAILGTLIGTFLIAVIGNGMNLTGIESYTQKVVLGLVILGAIVLDRVRRRGWSWLRERHRL